MPPRDLVERRGSAPPGEAWSRRWADSIVLMQALGLLVIVAAGLKILSLRTVLGILDTLIVSHPPSGAGEHTHRIAYLVAAAARYAIVRPNCLLRALVLQALLRRRGVDTVLVLGVARRDKALQAHAWLETSGHIVPGFEAAETFQPLLRWTSPHSL